MLLGEDLGGGHEGGLPSGGDDLGGGEGGDDGFSGADVALEEAAHGAWLGEVGGNFFPDLLLARGELEGKGGEEILDELAALGFCGGGLGNFAGSAPAEAGLEEEEFLVDEEVFGGFEGLPGFRKMEGFEGFEARGAAEAIGCRGGEGRGLDFAEGTVDEPTEDAGGDAF